MSDLTAPDAVRDLGRELERIRKTIAVQPGRQLQSNTVRNRMKEFVQTYFRVARPLLLAIQVDVGATDSDMQSLLELGNKTSSIAHYRERIASLKSRLNSLELAIETQLSNFAVSNQGLQVTEVERRILATLASPLPTTASSYQQVLADLSDSKRASYRGTATELREILRETLDYMAPDADVAGAPGFALEKDRTKPTMAQKARYILRQRGLPRNSIDVPRKAIEIVEETVSTLVRSTYDRGSIDTHTSSGISRPKVQQLKMYVDSVLCEILEIHGKS